MALMNGPKTKQALHFCINRDGNKCRICGKHPRDVGPLELDHVDGDRTFNPPDGSNWQAACHKCNCRKDTRGAGKKKVSTERERERVRERGRERETEYLRDLVSIRSTTAEMVKNHESEGVYRRWLTVMVESEGEIDVTDAINGGAEVASCSPQTARRYFDKCTSIAGAFQVDLNEQGRKVVRLRRRLPTPPAKQSPTSLPDAMFRKKEGGEE